MGMDSILLAVALLFAAGGFGMALWVVLRPPAVSFEAPEVLDLEQIREGFAHDVAQMTKEIEDLRLAVDYGIQRVQTTERRIKSTVHRARKELQERGLEHDGLEAEVTEISGWDGEGSPEPRMPVMPENVGPVPSSIPGVPAETLAKVRSLR